MEDKKQSYFGEVGSALKTLATGMKVTMKEYFTPKSTEQYPENRKTTLHVAKRHRGRLVFKRDEEGVYKCTACTMCEKACPNGTIKILSEMVTNPETGKKKKQLLDYEYDLGDCMFCELCINYVCGSRRYYTGFSRILCIDEAHHASSNSIVVCSLWRCRSLFPA